MDKTDNEVMSPQERYELKINNRILVAKFDGWYQDLVRYKNNGRVNWVHPVKSGKGIIFPSTEDRFEKYETSWDWLMPVVEKIAKMNEFSTYIERYNVISLSIASSIEAVYKAVVLFIHWYNSTQNKEKVYNQTVKK